MEFPTKHSEDTSVHFASMLTTDSNPTGEDIDRGNAISNTVKAADLDTFSFYDNTENCNLFLSIKGVSLLIYDMLLTKYSCSFVPIKLRVITMILFTLYCWQGKALCCTINNSEA